MIRIHPTLSPSTVTSLKWPPLTHKRELRARGEIDVILGFYPVNVP
jgi:hypothetical protein